MKKLLFIIIALLLVTLSCFTTIAHPGRTDSSGGHYDRSTGEYHYHHGYSAHQHTNGECPYDFDDKTDHNSSSGSTTHPTLKSTIEHTTQATTKTKAEKESYAKYIIGILAALLIGTIVYILLLKEELTKIRTQLKTESSKLNQANKELTIVKNNFQKSENELDYHLVLKEALENAKAPKYGICLTPLLKKHYSDEIKLSNEIQLNTKLKYHSCPDYIKTNNIIVNALGADTFYTYDYLIERCFKHIYSYKGSRLPRKDMISELQNFLNSWLMYYPALITGVDEDSLALYILIALSKRMLLNGTTKTDIFGIHKYRKDDVLTSEGIALKLFIDFCYRELYVLEKITENTMDECLINLRNMFPDTF